ncbi:MAG: hypothetical protein AAF939_03530 [Planctomycetota bacterium]
MNRTSVWHCEQTRIRPLSFRVNSPRQIPANQIIEILVQRIRESKPRYSVDAVLLAFVLITHLAISLYFALHLSISVEETYLLEKTGGTLADCFDTRRPLAGMSSLFVCLAWGWQCIFGGSLISVRLLNVCLTAGVCLIAFDLAKAIKIKQPIFFAAMMAIHPSTIMAASVSKDCAVVLFLSALLSRIFVSGFVTGNGRSQLTYFVLASISICLNLFLGLLVFTQFLLLPLLNRKYEFEKYRNHLFLIPLAVLPIVFLTGPAWHYQQASIVEVSRFVTGSLSNSMLPLPRTDSTLFTRYLVLLGIAAVCFLVFRSGQAQVNGSRWTVGIVVYLAFLSVVFSIALAISNVELTNELSYPLILPAVGCWVMFLEGLKPAQKSGLMFFTLLCFGYTLSFSFCDSATPVSFAPQWNFSTEIAAFFEIPAEQMLNQ